jgi:hypothetical protein
MYHPLQIIIFFKVIIQQQFNFRFLQFDLFFKLFLLFIRLFEVLLIRILRHLIIKRIPINTIEVLPFRPSGYNTLIRRVP